MDRYTDLEIAQSCRMSPIEDVAAKINIDECYLESYGRYKAKIDLSYLGDGSARDGKLILVTAITPTPAGEGKTTTAIGLADALRYIGENAAAALREPSLGPVFGIKGGACGGGYAQIVPMEDINLHFTGDIHAIGAANNLLAAMIDNHIKQGNELRLDPTRITWRRCVDMNDRQLRFIRDGLGGSANGVSYDASTSSPFGAGVLKVVGGPEAWTSAAQDVPINEKGGTYIVSGWAKANAIGSTGTDYGSSKPNMRHNSQTMCR